MLLLKDTLTGQTKLVNEEYDCSWYEGNWSCDCNRSKLFGHDEPCGSGRYVVIEIDGKPNEWEGEC